MANEPDDSTPGAASPSDGSSVSAEIPDAVSDESSAEDRIDFVIDRLRVAARDGVVRRSDVECIGDYCLDRVSHGRLYLSMVNNVMDSVDDPSALLDTLDLLSRILSNDNKKIIESYHDHLIKHVRVRQETIMARARRTKDADNAATSPNDLTSNTSTCPPSSKDTASNTDFETAEIKVMQMQTEIDSLKKELMEKDKSISKKPGLNKTGGHVVLQDTDPCTIEMLKAQLVTLEEHYAAQLKNQEENYAAKLTTHKEQADAKLKDRIAVEDHLNREIMSLRARANGSAENCGRAGRTISAWEQKLLEENMALREKLEAAAKTALSAKDTKEMNGRSNEVKGSGRTHVSRALSLAVPAHELATTAEEEDDMIAQGDNNDQDGRKKTICGEIVLRLQEEAARFATGTQSFQRNVVAVKFPLLLESVVDSILQSAGQEGEHH